MNGLVRCIGRALMLLDGTAAIGSAVEGELAAPAVWLRGRRWAQ